MMYDAIFNQQQGEQGSSDIDDVEINTSSQQVDQGVQDLENMEEFSNINVMISRWEAQEAKEDTLAVKMVKKQRRSQKLEMIVSKPGV